MAEIRKRSLSILALTACVIVGASVGFVQLARTIRDPVGEAPLGGFAALRGQAEFETSDNCRVCHPDHHESWGRTFHRTMTQTASPQSVQGRFDGRSLEFLGVPSRPFREGDRFFLETSHPASGRIEPFEIVRTVGSRRIQQYVTRVGDRHLRLPLAFSKVEDRWFHLSEAFFHPDGESFHANTSVWDMNCIFCHNVKAMPGWNPQGVPPTEVEEFGIVGLPGTFDSEVEQLGIACEACHGPGGEHARRMRSPFRRAAFQAGKQADPTIVNPERLPKRRSVEICAHCHGQRVPSGYDVAHDIMVDGDPFLPGEDLARTWVPVTHATVLGENEFAHRFWKDGSPRLTAYEYQGLLRSRCFTEGEMTCRSCHAMHAGDPRGQLQPELLGNRMCLQCHRELGGERLSEHTKHQANSTGSECVACHMPAVVYGIMTWHPTHEIKSPDPAHSAAYQKPDACTLCHTGRSLIWATEKSRAWWPHARFAAGSFTAMHALPEIPRALVGGDVVYRALAAERLGRASPESTEVRDLAVCLLAQTLLDPYPNVRRSAGNSLRRLTGRQDVPGALEPVEKRQAFSSVLARSLIQRPSGPSVELMLDDAGLPDAEILATLRASREEVPVSIGE